MVLQVVAYNNMDMNSSGDPKPNNNCGSDTTAMPSSSKTKTTISEQWVMKLSCIPFTEAQP